MQISPPPYSTVSTARLLTFFQAMPAKNTTDKGGDNMDTSPWLNSKKPFPDREYKYAIPTDKPAAINVTHLPILRRAVSSISIHLPARSSVNTVLKEFSPDDTVSIRAAIRAAMHNPSKPWGISCFTRVI